MKLSWKARRRWAIVVLLVAMPAWVVSAVSVLALFDRPPFWLELVIYVGLGVLWVLPLKRLFRGIGQPPPEDERD